jgi:hypothetical protein
MYSDDDRVTGNADSPTGVIPRPTQEELARRRLAKESPQPPIAMPEMEGEDANAITGQFRIDARAEGEDTAKNADDKPTQGA